VAIESASVTFLQITISSDNHLRHKTTASQANKQLAYEAEIKQDGSNGNISDTYLIDDNFEY
jgi:hypothetical protein